MKPVIIVASQLSGQGPTGVETHFNQILAVAAKKGIETLLVTPEGSFSIEKKFAGAVRRALKIFSLERSILWLRWTNCRRHQRRLAAAINQFRGQSITLYVQDPLSARAAIAARGTQNCRIVAVVHFNVSEANEMFEKGLAKERGVLWNSLMSTEREVLPRVDNLIFVSDFMRHIVNKRIAKVDSVPQFVISNFPSLPDISGNEAPPLADLISIGTLEPRKNQAFLLHVLAECKARGRCFTLSLVGDGPDRQHLREIAHALGIAEQINFLGFQPQAASLIPRHRFFVHASRMESQGIVLIEALSYKRPVLAGRVGGIPEVLTDGQEGYYWDLDDPKSSADQLIDVLDDTENWHRLSERAGTTFSTRFHPEVLGERWLNVLLG